MDVDELVHGLHEGVAEPLGKFVERYDGFPGLRGGCYGKGGEWPGVAERGVVEGCAGGGPDGGEAIDENRPEGWEEDNGNGGCLSCGVGD